jgi:ubiquinone/menaquinone biosynthesis C-methylase UbiE
MNMKSEEIRKKYDETATGYDWKITLMEKISGAARLRQNLLQKARGRVLDVACGTGRNFPYYPKDCQITAIDLSAGMLEQARQRAEHLGLEIQLVTQDVEQLDFPSQSFDTVVSSLAVCTYPNPVEALTEMTRVCKSDGQLLLLEHGRSSCQLLGRLQDIFASSYAKHTGCQINREPLELVQDAGLHIRSSRRSFLGILHTIEAQPSK